MHWYAVQKWQNDYVRTICQRQPTGMVRYEIEFGICEKMSVIYQITDTLPFTNNLHHSYL